MAKDKICTPFLALASPENKFTVSTIEDMKGRKYLKIGDVVELNGYYTAGDGAGHKRKIEANDDGSGVQLANGLWANIVHNGEVNVSWFGAKGDGVTDDSISLKRFLSTKDASLFIFGKNLKYRHGGEHNCLDEDISLSIIDSSGFTINGNGSTVFSDFSNKNIVTNRIFDFLNCHNFKIENLIIDGSKNERKPIGGDPAGSNNQNNLQLVSCTGVVIENVKSINSVMDCLHITTDGWGFGYVKSKKIKISNSTFNNGYRQGCSVVNADEVSFYLCEFSHTGSDFYTEPACGIDFEGFETPNGFGQENCLVENCTFIDNKIKHIAVHFGTKNLKIRNNYFKKTIYDFHGVFLAPSSGEKKNNNSFITSNTFENCGLEMRGVSAMIERNYLNGYAEIHLSPEEIVVFRENSFFGNTKNDGELKNFSLTTNRNCIVENNVFHNCFSENSVGESKNIIYLSQNKGSFVNNKISYSELCTGSISQDPNSVDKFVFEGNLIDENYKSGVFLKEVQKPKIRETEISFFLSDDEILKNGNPILIFDEKTFLRLEVEFSGSYKNYNSVGYGKYIITYNAGEQVLTECPESDWKAVSGGFAISDIIKNSEGFLQFSLDRNPYQVTESFVKIKAICNSTSGTRARLVWDKTNEENFTYKRKYAGGSKGNKWQIPSIGTSLTTFDEIVEGSTFINTDSKKIMFYNMGMWVESVATSELNTPYHTLKMQQEGVYEDFIQYMDEKTEYDRLQKELEQQRQLAFEQRENQEQTYEEWLAEQPMMLPVENEPQPSKKLLVFKEKYLG